MSTRLTPLVHLHELGCHLNKIPSLFSRPRSQRGFTSSEYNLFDQHMSWTAEPDQGQTQWAYTGTDVVSYSITRHTSVDVLPGKATDLACVFRTDSHSVFPLCLPWLKRKLKAGWERDLSAGDWSGDSTLVVLWHQQKSAFDKWSEHYTSSLSCRNRFM